MCPIHHTYVWPKECTESALFDLQALHKYVKGKHNVLWKLHSDVTITAKALSKLKYNDPHKKRTLQAVYKQHKHTFTLIVTHLPLPALQIIFKKWCLGKLGHETRHVWYFSTNVCHTRRRMICKHLLRLTVNY